MCIRDRDYRWSILFKLCFPNSETSTVGYGLKLHTCTQTWQTLYCESIVKGIINQCHYTNVLKTRLLHQVRKWFPDRDLVFIHDGAPCHVAKIVAKCLKENGVQVPPWPGNSLDLNPIKNSWVTPMKKIKKETISSKTELITSLIQTWSLIPHHVNEVKNNCIDLIKRMAKMLRMVIKSKGMRTKY